jgi:hypothetical protein
MRVDAPFKPVDQLDWLKGITNRTNVLHILVGNYDLYDFRNLSGQAARRGRDLHFPRYRLESQVECEEFVGALRYLLERVPLLCDLNGLLSQWRWFAEWSIGCVGILRDWVIDTVAAICKEGGTTLTFDTLKQYALHIDQRIRLEMEARTGEHKIEVGKARSEQQLQELLGQAPSPVQTPVSSPKMPKKRPIERAAQRDPVGDTAVGEITGKCPSFGILELSPAIFMQSGVSKVECPACASMRSLSVQGQTVRFPSHDKRKTITPNVDPRWAKQGAGWEVVGK